MNILNKVSLRLRIMIVVNLIVFVFGIIVFGLFQKFRVDYVKDTYNNYLNFAINVSHIIQDQFFERYGDVQAFAMNETLKKMDKEKLPAVLDEYVTLYGLYDVILVVDKNGKYVSSNTKDTQGKPVKQEVLEKLNFSQTVWFKKTINGEFSEDKVKNFNGTYFEDFNFDPIKKLSFGEDRVGTSFSAQIKDEKGEVIGVVTNRSTAKWLEESIVRTYEDLKRDDLGHSEITVVDKNGFIIVDHDPHQNNDKNEVVYDFENTIFKINLAEMKLKAAEDLVAGKNGITEELHKRKKVEQINGYAKVNGPKIIDSVGWGIIIRGEKAEVLAHINQVFNLFYLVFVISLVAGFVVTYFFGNQIAKSLSNVTSLLSSNAENLSNTSNTLTVQSTRLSESSTEQASAIQETMAAVDEISATVEKNTEAARQSKSVSGDSLQASNVGKQTVVNMLNSIEEISQSNDSIAEQMKSNNEKINEIVKLIADIGNKTKVINEIVFQTKLLSFNASVEAARAGEYGKGFAVVAEEVGNLAQMSGNAAKEISSMLDESQRKTAQIVKETESKVEELIHKSREKIDQGKRTANECNTSLEEIAKNVKLVDEMVSEISRASEEQSNGIKEIAKAMGQLDITTSENSKISQESSSSSIEVNAKSEELKTQVESLLKLVNGSNSKLNTLHTVDNRPVAHEKKTAPVAKVKANVVSFKKKETIARVPSKNNNHETTSQKAVSGDSVPSSNDPRFEEV